MTTSSSTPDQTDPVDSDAVQSFLTSFHNTFCQQLEALDGKGKFIDDAWTREEGGGGLTRIMTDGAVFEKAGVAFSRVNGTTLPPSASAHRPAML